MFMLAEIRLSETLKQIDAAGTFKHERVITSTQQAEIRVQGSAKPVLNFCANNYLGLSAHPAVMDAAKSAIDTHGFGLSSVRFICGTQDLHKDLERASKRNNNKELPY
jgi:glycine C-acetyltransferase